MVTIILQVVGTTAVVAGTLLLDLYLRRHPTKKAAVRTSRVSHTLYWLGLVIPGFVGIIHPGLAHFDQILGLPSLPARPLVLGLGIIAVAAGVTLTLLSQMALRRLGQGTNAFRLTRRLVAGNIYARTRNPMSLGYYSLCVGLGLIAGSTYVTLGSLLGIVPVHAFNLLYFEEQELALRLGPAYQEYKRAVPFLIPRRGAHYPPN